MKVVLFCGGLGTRLREYSETIPKPMVEIGYRPIIWHLMKFYAHFGHNEFILCLGYLGNYIKKYFLQYDECLSNDFTMENGGRTLYLQNTDISDWKITFVDTGLNSNIGQRLVAVKPYLEGEEVFMANYSDGLCDVNLDQYLSYFEERNKIASFLSVRPSQSLHYVKSDENHYVTSFEPIDRGGFWINGGFFIFKQSIFNYIQTGEELVLEPFQRLMLERQLITFQNPGFWACMDTFKEKKMFDDMYSAGQSPWMVWDQQPTRETGPSTSLPNNHDNSILLDRSNIVANRQINSL